MKSESESRRGRTSGRSRGSAFQRNGEPQADRYGRYGGDPGAAGPADPYGGRSAGPGGGRHAAAGPYGTGAGAERPGDPYGERTAGVFGGSTAGTDGGRPGDPSGGRASGRYGRRDADPYGRQAARSQPPPAGGRDAAYGGRPADPYGRGTTSAAGGAGADRYGGGTTRVFDRDDADRYGHAATTTVGAAEADPYGRETDRYGRQGGAGATRTMPRASATATMTAPAPTVTAPKAPPGTRGGPPPADDGTGNGLLVLILFWSGLIAGVALWWFDTPGGSLHGTAAVLTAAGRITGMAAGFTLIVQVLMMSRVAWLETWVGAHNLLRWHRSMGAYVLIMVLVHIACVVVGYAGTGHVSVLHEGWTMLTTLPDIVSATVATGILVAIAFMAIRTLRRSLPYELWHLLHDSAYLVLLLGYGHQFADGQELSKGGVATWYWGGLYALTVACLLWGRVIEPLWLNLRHGLRVVEVVPESTDMFSVYVGGRGLDRLDARAGQFFRWRFLTSSCWWQSHPFSLSAAPNRRFLRLTVSAVGDHTRRLRRLRPGTRVMVAGPSGTFTADRRTRPGALLIAGGSGIAPIRALMEDMPPGTLVIYRASSMNDLVLRAELEALAWQRGLGIQYVLGSRHDDGPRRLFTPAGMRELIPDVARRDVYLCGPPGLVESAVKTLHRLKVPKRQIHLDPFEF